jgi:hypothetical protein
MLRGLVPEDVGVIINKDTDYMLYHNTDEAYGLPMLNVSFQKYGKTITIGDLGADGIKSGRRDYVLLGHSYVNLFSNLSKQTQDELLKIYDDAMLAAEPYLSVKLNQTRERDKEKAIGKKTLELEKLVLHSKLNKCDLAFKKMAFGKRPASKNITSGQKTDISKTVG